MPPPPGFKPQTLRCLTYNTKGLNIPEKRRRLLREAAANRTSVLFVQETHFRLGSAPQLLNSDFPTGHFSDYHGGRSRGVAILFSKSVPMLTEEILSDREGRYWFVKGKIAEKQYTFASIYLPNVNQHRCLKTILRRLSSFTEGMLVVAGDLNVPLDPRFDTSAGKSSIPSNVLRHIRRSLDDLQLVDVWRAHHAGERDYSFYSPVHASYSRLDYLFVRQQDILLTEEASILAQTCSDHCPILAVLSSPLFRPTDRQWRFNTSMLSDPLLVTEIYTCLRTFFEKNDSPDIPNPTIWEAHKAVVRGGLISLATALKRTRSSLIQNLINDIRSLKLLHHTSALDLDYEQLTSKRKELNDLLNTDIRFASQKAKCHFALLENKPGRLLTRILRKRQNASYIARIKLPDGTFSSRPDHILNAFQHFYQGLYDMDQMPSPCPSTTAIAAYLSNTVTRTLSPAMIDLLDAPVTSDELLSVLRNLKRGKCPGPDGLPAEYYRTFSSTLTPKLLSLFFPPLETELSFTHIRSRPLSQSFANLERRGPMSGATDLYLY
uniref:exodeoxyribonuclease III n=1 Tax=Leptobrachium leishanense TaxID=445787 RepID=A0A8C5Q1J8_9ANUR